MSFHRENVIWQSENGTWNRGFFAAHTHGNEDEGYDPEWDVDYDYSEFEWVSAGHSTEKAAEDSWDGSNPGGYTLIRKGDLGHATAASRYDAMVREFDRAR